MQNNAIQLLFRKSSLQRSKIYNFIYCIIDFPQNVLIQNGRAKTAAPKSPDSCNL